MTLNELAARLAGPRDRWGVQTLCVGRMYHVWVAICDRTVAYAEARSLAEADAQAAAMLRDLLWDKNAGAPAMSAE